ncbi:hypothetical protein B0H14DRAFT_3443617 [Mycena olivaceomarginata]|nr:hypothetical protein B0H14DRAFT_3443617 [Mycena olivaceomarginata]
MPRVRHSRHPRHQHRDIDPLKLRFLRHHWPQYLVALDTHDTLRFFIFVLEDYIKRYGYSLMSEPWTGGLPEDDNLALSRVEAQSRQLLSHRIKHYIKAWYRNSDGVWKP